MLIAGALVVSAGNLCMDHYLGEAGKRGGGGGGGTDWLPCYESDKIVGESSFTGHLLAKIKILSVKHWSM